MLEWRTSCSSIAGKEDRSVRTVVGIDGSIGNDKRIGRRRRILQMSAERKRLPSRNMSYVAIVHVSPPEVVIIRLIPTHVLHTAATCCALPRRLQPSNDSIESKSEGINMLSALLGLNFLSLLINRFCCSRDCSWLPIHAVVFYRRNVSPYSHFVEKIDAKLC